MKKNQPQQLSFLQENEGGKGIIPDQPLQPPSASPGEECGALQCARCPSKKDVIFTWAREKICRECWHKIWESLPYSSKLGGKQWR